MFAELQGDREGIQNQVCHWPQVQCSLQYFQRLQRLFLYVYTVLCAFFSAYQILHATYLY